jgi:hypothetical protein
MPSQTKVKVFAIYEEKRNNLKIEKDIKYIGYTERDEQSALSTFKSAVKLHDPLLSHKLQELDVNTNNLKIQRLSNCFLNDVATVVNHFINKHDTIENGWNTELRS